MTDPQPATPKDPDTPPPAGPNDDEPVFFGAREADTSDPRVVAQSYLTYLATRNLRQDAAHVIAVAAAGLWVIAAWPEHFSKTVREDMLILWFFLVAGGIVLRIVEWRRRVLLRRMAARISQTKSDPRETPR